MERSNDFAASTKDDFPSEDVQPVAAEDAWTHDQYARLESLGHAVNHARGRGSQWDVIGVANDFANYVIHGEGVEGVVSDAQA